MNEVALCLPGGISNISYWVQKKPGTKGYIHNILYHLRKFKSVQNNGHVVYGHMHMLCVKTDMEVINSKARLGVPGEGVDG